jgi:hypothetical protein
MCFLSSRASSSTDSSQTSMYEMVVLGICCKRVVGLVAEFRLTQPQALADRACQRIIPLNF